MVELPPQRRLRLGQAVVGGTTFTAFACPSSLGPWHPLPAVRPGTTITMSRVATRVAMVFHQRFAARPTLDAGGACPPRLLYAAVFSLCDRRQFRSRVLYGRDENEPRHPASLTKVMTLYLLFEQIEKKHLTLDSLLACIAARRRSMSPTKLGLRPGSTIRVEDAIKAIVTKSAKRHGRRGSGADRWR